MSRKFWLAVSIITFAVSVLALLFKDQLFGKNYNWKVHFDPNRNDPYGLTVLKNLLEEKRKIITIEQPLSLALSADSTIKNATYLGIADEMFYDTADCAKLFDFVKNGNKAFLSANDFPEQLTDSLFRKTCSDSFFFDMSNINDTAVVLKLDQTEIQHTFKYRNKKFIDNFKWTYFTPYTFCPELDSISTPLGTINDHFQNFIQISYGKGDLYLHTSPLAWSNLSFKQHSGLQYAERALSYINEGNIYWDVYSMSTESLNRMNQSERRQIANSPLQYILQEPSLAWAWYILLAIGLLFLLFRTKRQQRIIPVLEPNRNTSMEFLNIISNLYFQQRDHKKLAQEDMRLFLHFIRDRYKIPTRNLDDTFITQLTQQSQVEQDIIKKILLLNTNINSASHITENTLISFHQHIEAFYNNCH